MKRILHISAAVVICFVGVSAANADLFLTAEGENPTNFPLTIERTGPYQVALDGNTIIEPNDVGIEVIGGTLTPLPDVNHQYSFQFDGESAIGQIQIITNIDMTIDGIFIPADTTIYNLSIFCNPDVSIIGVNAIGRTEMCPPEQEEVIQSEYLVEQTPEQSGISSEESMLTGETRESQNVSASYNPSWDFNGDGIINFNDFATIGAGWQTTYDIQDLNSFCAAFGSIDCCIDTNNIPNPLDINNWQYVNFTGIGTCDYLDCWEWGEYYSDPFWDGCVNWVYVGCNETPEFDYYCAYNFWYNGSTRVGLCVYDCGINYFWVLKNTGGCRIRMTRHITRDRPPQDPYCNPPYPSCDSSCDEQTIDYYNWQVVLTDININNITRIGSCKQAYTFDPNIGYGNNGPCKLVWW